MRSSAAASFCSDRRRALQSRRRSVGRGRKYPGLSVLQIDAHADMRDAYMGTRHNHACAMRRSLGKAATQVGIRSLSTEEAEALPRLNTTVFYDVDMRRDPKWIDAVVDSLEPDVCVTIDVDGMTRRSCRRPARPEPGGLTWAEITALVRATAERRRIVAADLVELSPIPGMIAPNFLAAKLIYKLLTYKYAGHPRSKRV
jgi:agmatinase